MYKNNNKSSRKSNKKQNPELKQISKFETIKLLIENSTFAKYYKIVDIREGLEDYYVNVTIKQDYVDYYSLEKLKEDGLKVNTVKINRNYPEQITFSVMLLHDQKNIIV